MEDTVPEFVAEVAGEYVEERWAVIERQGHPDRTESNDLPPLSARYETPGRWARKQKRYNERIAKRTINLANIRKA